MNEYRDQAQDKDFEPISELLHATDCVPDAPDCRAAVMAKIARPRPVRRFVWAYASGFAALLVAAIGFAPFLMNSDKGEMVAYSPRVEHTAPAPSAPEKASKPTTYAFEPQPAPVRQRHLRVRYSRIAKPAMMAKAVPSETRSVPVLGDRATVSGKLKAASPAWYYESKSRGMESADSLAKKEPTAIGRPSMGYSLITPGSRSAKSAGDDGNIRAYDYVDATVVPARRERPSLGGTVAASPAAPAKEGHMGYGGNSYYSGALEKDRAAGRPVALAMVTWPSASNQNSSDYSYTDRDTATGETTECRVKRSGNSVEIYLESKPAVPPPPVKGSLDHETKPSV